MKYIIRSLLVFMVIIIFSNLPFVDKLVLKAIDVNTFRYSNRNGAYTRVQGFDFKDGYFNPRMIHRYVEKEKPLAENKKLYRLYKINPLCFWRWGYYYTSSKDFEYLDWEEIEPTRVSYHPDSRWQDF